MITNHLPDVVNLTVGNEIYPTSLLHTGCLCIFKFYTLSYTLYIVLEYKILCRIILIKWSMIKNMSAKINCKINIMAVSPWIVATEETLSPYMEYKTYKMKKVHECFECWKTISRDSSLRGFQNYEKEKVVILKNLKKSFDLFHPFSQNSFLYVFIISL